MCGMSDEPPKTEQLLAQAAAGDGAAWGSLLTAHEERLIRMVAFRMDPRLRGRIDAADVVQEAFVQASAHREDFFSAPEMSLEAVSKPSQRGGQSHFAPAASAKSGQSPTDLKLPLFLWLRKIVCNKLFESHRHHLGTHMRDANRDRPLAAPQNWDDTAEVLWLHLSGHLTSPSAAAVKREARTRLAEALDRMDATDREVLMLRHFEQLTNAEAARVVGIEERAAGKRYLRALARLRKILSELPGGLTGLGP
jgi:RNA polymerase sigma-70 factor (ECF subfamily)